MSLRRVVGLLAIAAIAGLAGGAAAAQSSVAGRDAEVRIVAEVLRANGVDDPARRAAAAERVHDAIDRLSASLSRGRTSWRKAARLHERLHHELFRVYRAEADGLVGIVDDGAFNCVSATLFYGLAARRLGFDATVLEYPGHLLLRLRMGQRRVDVETTDPDGFDLARFPGWTPRRAPARAAEGAGEPFGSPATGLTFWEVELEQAVGFAWLNRAWRLEQAGDPVGAARAARNAIGALPQGGASDDLVLRLLARAFRETYESGEFEQAFEVASIDAALFSERTTSRDRLLAAGMKLVEAACQADRIDRARAVVSDVRAAGADGAELAQFERLAMPLIAVTAVRGGAWAAAREAATRFAEVEPDPVEARRLAEWVEARRRGAADTDAADAGPPAGAPPRFGFAPRPASGESTTR